MLTPVEPCANNVVATVSVPDVKVVCMDLPRKGGNEICNENIQHKFGNDVWATLLLKEPQAYRGHIAERGKSLSSFAEVAVK